MSVAATEAIPVSRAYWTCLTDEALVLLFRDESSEKKPVDDVSAMGGAEADDEWFLHGWWD